LFRGATTPICLCGGKRVRPGTPETFACSTNNRSWSCGDISPLLRWRSKHARCHRCVFFLQRDHEESGFVVVSSGAAYAWLSMCEKWWSGQYEDQSRCATGGRGRDAGDACSAHQLFGRAAWTLCFFGQPMDCVNELWHCPAANAVAVLPDTCCALRLQVDNINRPLEWSARPSNAALMPDAHFVKPLPASCEEAGCVHCSRACNPLRGVWGVNTSELFNSAI